MQQTPGPVETPLLGAGILAFPLVAEDAPVTGAGPAPQPARPLDLLAATVSVLTLLGAALRRSARRHH